MNSVAFHMARKAQPLPTLVDEQLRVGHLLVLARRAGDAASVERHMKQLEEAQIKFAATGRTDGR